ncbi:MAG TPA: hypothetical protein VHD55_02050 [Candidatus Paceibacterota bacterium]|nr:hypothetical protein [Candidatus Paceibacterota bacterium]
MKTIKTSFALTSAGFGMFTLLVLSPLVLQANTIGASAGAGMTVCTMDAMQCPDGSWVGRSGPKCEFKCPGTADPAPAAYTFSASPKWGDAPLKVDFYSKLMEPNRYTVDFGDGSRSKYGECLQSSPAQCSLTHTYAKAGTYTALLIQDACPDNVQCIWAGKTVGKATIVVSDKDDSNPHDGDDHGHDWHATTTPGNHYGWFSWFSNFHFKFWPFWK